METPLAAEEQHDNWHRFLVTVVPSAVIPISISLIWHNFFSETRWIHEPFHALVEGAGSFAALLLSMFIVIMRDNRQLPAKYIWVATTLIGMGLLDGFHAAMRPGNTFVWLHSLATFLGGIIFALVTLPERIASLPWIRHIPYIIAVSSVVIGIASIVDTSWIPTMISADDFTLQAGLLNIIGGGGFILAWYHFAWRADSEARKGEQVLLANHCLLFGMAGILFEFSSLWDGTWWLWHILRLFAYLVLLSFFVGLYRQFMQQAVQSQETLELKVAQRTAALKDNERILRDERDFADSLVNTAQAVILVLDVEGRIVRFNPYMEKLTGYALEEVQGEDWFSLFLPTDDVEDIKTLFKQAVSDIDTHGKENPIVAKDGRQIEIKWYSKTLKDSAGGVTGLLAIGYDVTDMKRHEELAQRQRREIEQLNYTLEQKVQTRAMELEESLHNLHNMQHKLVESAKMASLGKLVAGVAHEINTPLGIGVTAGSHIHSLSKRLEKTSSNADELKNTVSEIEEAADMLLSNLKRAAHLVNSFKQVAVDQTSEEKRIFNLKNYLDEVFMGLRPRYKRTRHTVAVECPDNLIVESFPGALAQIITNLVINSLIHGFAGIEEGVIRLKVTEENDKSITFTYSDDGNGISEEDVKRIFDPFFTTRRGQGGSGLGMHIVYNLVSQTLGGTISCQSSAGQGAVFTFTMDQSRT